MTSAADRVDAIRRGFTCRCVRSRLDLVWGEMWEDDPYRRLDWNGEFYARSDCQRCGGTGEFRRVVNELGSQKEGE